MWPSTVAAKRTANNKQEVVRIHHMEVKERALKSRNQTVGKMTMAARNIMKLRVVSPGSKLARWLPPPGKM